MEDNIRAFANHFGGDRSTKIRIYKILRVILKDKDIVIGTLSSVLISFEKVHHRGNIHPTDCSDDITGSHETCQCTGKVPDLFCIKKNTSNVIRGIIGDFRINDGKRHRGILSCYFDQCIVEEPTDCNTWIVTTRDTGIQPGFIIIPAVNRKGNAKICLGFDQTVVCHFVPAVIINAGRIDHKSNGSGWYSNCR